MAMTMAMTTSKGLIKKITTLHIRHLDISHNASYLPPKILHNLCFSFLLDIPAVPTEIENNAYAKLWGANKVHYGRCASGVCIALFGKFIAVLYMTDIWNFIMQGSEEDIMNTQKWQQVTLSINLRKIWLQLTNWIGWNPCTRIMSKCLMTSKWYHFVGWVRPVMTLKGWFSLVTESESES